MVPPPWLFQDTRCAVPGVALLLGGASQCCGNECSFRSDILRRAPLLDQAEERITLSLREEKLRSTQRQHFETTEYFCYCKKLVSERRKKLMSGVGFR